MNDNTLILEEAKRQAEEDLKVRESKIERNFTLATGLVIVVGIIVLYVWVGLLVCFLVPLVALLAPFVIYFGLRSLAARELVPALIAVDCLKNEPQVATEYFLRAWCLYTYKFYEPAMEDVNKAIDLDPSTVEYYRLRGDAYEKLGNLDQADADRRKAQELADRS